MQFLHIFDRVIIKYIEQDLGVISMDKSKKLIIVMSVVLLITVYAVTRFFGLLNKDGLESHEKYGDKQENDKTAEDMEGKVTIVLDAGHGGVDPGKVGVNGLLEKDINLQIVMKLKEALEKDETIGAKVVLTRDEDMGHYDENDSNKKRADMNKRCEIINEVSPDLVISIHQNSYHSSAVKGAQVFYYEKSEKGKALANKIQGSLVRELAGENKGRVEKANDSYYLILNVKCPAVIVECGFLSNESESKLLGDSEYQDKITKAIIDGIKEYLQQY